MTDFNHVATRIIKESINSAIYIDDKVGLPFENEEGFDNHSDLFHSFKESDCLVDFERFSAATPKDYQKILSTKDLLILDWHLNEDEDNISATFDIISQALKSPNLHFCVIYTKQKQADLYEKVIFNIASFYSGLHTELCNSTRSAFDEFLNEFGIDKKAIKTIKESIVLCGKNLFINPKETRTILEDLDKNLTEIDGKKSLIKFLNDSVLPVSGYPNRMICLSFILSQMKVPDKAVERVLIKSLDSISIQLNNLIIKVFDKSEISDNSLYSSFTESLISSSNIFLTLLGLELRSRYRETSGFIGSELDEVNYLAFFHHRENHFKDDDSGVINKELFNEFLKDIWKDQVSSFLMEKDFKLFDVIDDYKQKNDIDLLLTNFKHANPEHQESIAILNWVYNRLSVNRKVDDELRFGDVFTFESGKETKYIICITPICDCLRPNKINNCFFFIEGKDIGMKNGVQKTDGDFISFIKKDNKPTCIDWTSNQDKDCKPFTLYVADNRLRGNEKTIEFTFRGVESKAKYVCTIKENYAQRIANRAFFYPLRVGIDFASFPKN